MSLIPHRFLFRLAFPCRYRADLPCDDDDSLLDLPPECRIDNFPAMDGQVNFADLWLAWNESGLAVQLEVRGKDAPPAGSPGQPRGSDGVTLWLDTRGDRTSHRASRTCHQFHLLVAGGGSDGDAPLVLQSKINRALQDAPVGGLDDVPIRFRAIRSGYRLEAFLPAPILNGFDPDEHPRLGFYYSVRDHELGEQTLTVSPDFPFADDPSLWSTLDLVK